MAQAQLASKTKAKPKSAPPGAQDAIGLLKEDHVKVKKLFKDFEKLKQGDGSSDAKAALAAPCMPSSVCTCKAVPRANPLTHDIAMSAC